MRRRLSRPVLRVVQAGPLSLFYGSLPSDALCSDNLEPVVRSLPCRSARGVASLLLPDLPRLLQGQYLGLSVQFRRNCGCVHCVYPLLVKFAYGYMALTGGEVLWGMASTQGTRLM